MAGAIELSPQMEAWRRLLREDVKKARSLAWDALRRMDETGHFHRTEIAMAYSRMMNGNAAPGDYGDGGVACA